MGNSQQFPPVGEAVTYFFSKFRGAVNRLLKHTCQRVGLYLKGSALDQLSWLMDGFCKIKILFFFVVVSHSFCSVPKINYSIWLKYLFLQHFYNRHSDKAASQKCRCKCGSLINKPNARVARKKTLRGTRLGT